MTGYRPNDRIQGQMTGYRTQDPGTRTQGPRNPRPGPRDQDQGPRNQDQGPRTRDQDQGPRNQDPGPNTRVPDPILPITRPTPYQPVYDHTRPDPPYTARTWHQVLLRAPCGNVSFSGCPGQLGYGSPHPVLLVSVWPRPPILTSNQG